jgi:FAD/FMN-containing dehydrogenase
MLYEFDGSVEKARPEVVVVPLSTEHVSGIVKLATKSAITRRRENSQDGT